MLKAVTYAYLILLAIAGILGLVIIVVRSLRLFQLRRHTRLVSAPRRALLMFAAEGGAEGADELVAMPQASWRAVEPTAVALLGKIRGEGHTALVGVFERRGEADAALRALHARSRVHRARAAEMLGNLRRRDAVAGLCGLLRDGQPAVRAVAVRSLGRIGDPAAAGPLLASLARTESTPSQLVAHALIQLGTDVERALIDVLNHESVLVRVTALDALGLLGAVGSAAPVAAALRNDSSLDVRVAAATALGRLGTRTAVAALTAASRAAEPIPLRSAATRALRDAGGSAAVQPLSALLGDRQYRVAHEAAQALRRLGPTGLAALARVVADDAAGPGRTGRALPGVAHAREALAQVALGQPSTEPEPVQSLAVVG